MTTQKHTTKKPNSSIRRERVYLTNSSDFWSDIHTPYRVDMWTDHNDGEDAWVWYDNGMNGIIEIDDLSMWKENSFLEYLPSEYLKSRTEKLLELNMKANRSDMVIEKIWSAISDIHKNETTEEVSK